MEDENTDTHEETGNDEDENYAGDRVEDEKALASDDDTDYYPTRENRDDRGNSAWVDVDEDDCEDSFQNPERKSRNKKRLTRRKGKINWRSRELGC